MPSSRLKKAVSTQCTSSGLLSQILSINSSNRYNKTPAVIVLNAVSLKWFKRNKPGLEGQKTLALRVLQRTMLWPKEVWVNLVAFAWAHSKRERMKHKVFMRGLTVWFSCRLGALQKEIIIAAKALYLGRIGRVCSLFHSTRKHAHGKKLLISSGRLSTHTKPKRWATQAGLASICFASIIRSWLSEIATFSHGPTQTSRRVIKALIRVVSSWAKKLSRTNLLRWELAMAQTLFKFKAFYCHTKALPKNQTQIRNFI